MTPLSSQAKLALAITSAGSQRNLAKLLGVTHQKVGRWLREGEPGGIKQIPREATDIINQAFRFHKDVTKAQAKADRLPYDPALPVYATRPTLRNGKPGERILISGTEYIRPDTRDAVFESLQKSKQINAISVRSKVDIRSYLQLKPSATNAQVLRAFKIRGARDSDGRNTLMQSFKYQQAREEKKQKGRALEGGSLMEMAVYTRMTNFSPRADIGLSLRDIASNLRQKHEPHSAAPADQYLVQTLPGQYESFNQPKRQTAKEKRDSLKRK
jgi:hypothetical protein